MCHYILHKYICDSDMNFIEKLQSLGANTLRYYKILGFKEQEKKLRGKMIACGIGYITLCTGFVMIFKLEK